MKKSTVFISLICFALLISMLSFTLTSCSKEEIISKFEYELSNDDTYEIVKYEGNVKEVSIPSEYNGKKVTCISYAAFSNCSSLINIEIPNSITYIDNHAFRNCDNLSSLYIPASVEDMGTAIIRKCKNLKELVVDENNKNYSSVSNCILSKDLKKLVLGCKNSIIPSTVEVIGVGAFEGCYDIKDLNIPTGVKLIESNAFFECSNLQTVHLSNSVEAVAGGAFSGCDKLKNISIDPNNKNLEVKGNCLLSKDGKLLIMGFNNSVIPDSVTRIATFSFCACNKLGKLIIPKTVLEVDSWAIFQCENLTIYCEAINKPDEWASDWNKDNGPVYWGCNI